MSVGGSGFTYSYSGIYGERQTQKLTPAEEEIIRVSFDYFKDETNVLSTQKLKEAFESMGRDASEIQLLIDDIDANGDGEITESEYRRIMTKKFLGENDDDSTLMHAFEMLDQNRDGFIPLVELRHVLMKEGENPLSEQEADELMLFADVEGNGMIEYKSFLKWLTNPDLD